MRKESRNAPLTRPHRSTEQRATTELTRPTQQQTRGGCGSHIVRERSGSSFWWSCGGCLSEVQDSRGKRRYVGWWGFWCTTTSLDTPHAFTAHSYHHLLVAICKRGVCCSVAMTRLNADLIESVPVGRLVQFVRRTPVAATFVGDESQAPVPYSTGGFRPAQLVSPYGNQATVLSKHAACTGFARWQASI